MPSNARWDGYGATAVVVFAAQLLLGAINVYLKAPVWMQLVHLAAADVLWILLVLMTVEATTVAGSFLRSRVSSGD